MPKGFPLDLTGRKFGDWTVLERTSNGRHGQSRWLCRCACDRKRPIATGNLTLGKSLCCRSCSNRKIAAERRLNNTQPSRQGHTTMILTRGQDGVYALQEPGTAPEQAAQWRKLSMTYQRHRMLGELLTVPHPVTPMMLSNRTGISFHTIRRNLLTFEQLGWVKADGVLAVGVPRRYTLRDEARPALSSLLATDKVQ